jgi:hypothetical protein
VKPFTYFYQGQSYNAFTSHYLVDGFKSFQITMGDKTLIIAPLNVPDRSGKTVWQQVIKPGDKIEDQGLIQALGEGLHSAEMR